MRKLHLSHKLRSDRKSSHNLDASVFDSLSSQAIMRMEWYELMYLMIVKKCMDDIEYKYVESSDYKTAVNFLRTNPYGYYSDEFHYRVLEESFERRRERATKTKVLRQ